MRVKISNLNIGSEYEIESYGGLGGVRFYFTKSKNVVLRDYNHIGQLIWSEKISKRELKQYLKTDVVRWVSKI